MTNVAVRKAIHYDTAFLLLTCVTQLQSWLEFKYLPLTIQYKTLKGNLRNYEQKN